MEISKKRIAWLSVASNTALTGGKLAAGLMTGSVSILSEAAHSAIDLLAAAIATFSVHVSDRPPDQDHQYGHEKVENVSGVIEGLLILLAAVWIIFEAVDKLIQGVKLEFLGPGVAVMAISAVMNIIVATMLKRTSIKTRSVALEADAAHLYTDVYTSLGVFAGLLVISIGQRFTARDLTFLDPMLAIGVALLILSAGFKITRKSFMPLMDTAASQAEIDTINKILDDFHSQGVDFHKLRTRHAGGTLHVDLHMGCRPGVSLEQGHRLSHILKGKIEESIPGAKALIHVEPSKIVETLTNEDERIKCMTDELLKDDRVCDLSSLKVQSYEGELMVEVDIILEPGVTLAESKELTESLRSRLRSCIADIREISLRLHPGSGWQDAIHDEDKARIKELVGDYESSFADIHELAVTSSGGVHRVKLRLGVPPSLPVAHAHKIGNNLKRDILKLFNEIVEVDLHIEPCDEHCSSCHAACPVRPPARPDR